MGMPIFQVDAFTDRAFAGNPAAVCLPSPDVADRWLREVGAEMNLAETAFLWPDGDSYNLRWFTPTVEVDLCGHATLAAAHVLWETGRLDAAATARFNTRSGLLTARRVSNKIELDFPAERDTEGECPVGLREALGADVRYTGQNRFDLITEVQDAGTLRNLHPDFRRLREISVRGVIVTCRSDLPDYSFISRFFAPAAGIDEDPVTGSAHCCLGPFWQLRLGRSEMSGYQASRRGGVVGVRMEGESVVLSGQAVTVLKGELMVAH